MDYENKHLHREDQSNSQQDHRTPPEQAQPYLYEGSQRGPPTLLEDRVASFFTAVSKFSLDKPFCQNDARQQEQ